MTDNSVEKNTEKKVNQQNIPKLRFNFSSPWKTCKFKDVCSVEMGQSPSSNNYTENSNDTILVQGNADLCNGKVVPRLYTSEVTKVSKPGEIILTVRAPVGDIAINEYDCCIGRGVCSIEGNKFIYYLLNYFKETRMWNKYAQGSTFEAISSKDIKNLKINIPSAVEQEKISKFLSLIDKKINLLNNDLSQYNNFKKYLLQNIFAQKLRFDGFEEEWIQTTIDELFEVITDYVAAGSFADIRNNVQYQKEGFAQLIRTADLKNKFKNDDYVYVNKHAFEYLYRVNLNEKCIVLPNIGNIGEVYFVNPNNLPHEHNVLAPNAILLKSSKNIEFKYHLLTSYYFKNQLDIINESAGRGKFNKTNLKKIKLFVPPSKEEQNKIATCLSLTDQRIDLLQDQISHMENFKRGLLQSLFI